MFTYSVDVPPNFSKPYEKTSKTLRETWLVCFDNNYLAYNQTNFLSFVCLQCTETKLHLPMSRRMQYCILPFILVTASSQLHFYLNKNVSILIYICDSQSLFGVFLPLLEGVGQKLLIFLACFVRSIPQHTKFAPLSTPNRFWSFEKSC